MNLEINNICKSFGDEDVLQDVCYHDDITSVAVIGPSGGGKSTLLRIIGGLLIPDSGSIKMDAKEVIFTEKELHTYRKDIGFVFQSNGLFEHLTATENVTLPLIRTFNIDKTEAVDTAHNLFERFGLIEERDKYPYQLSGGQLQRIAIARAIAVKPKLLLLDEPTSALDPEYTTEVLDMLGELQAEGLRTIIVTHEMGFAKNACEKIIFLTNHTIVESGKSADIFSSAKTPELKSFLNKILEWRV